MKKHHNTNEVTHMTTGEKLRVQMDSTIAQDTDICHLNRVMQSQHNQHHSEQDLSACTVNTCHCVPCDTVSCTVIVSMYAGFVCT